MKRHLIALLSLFLLAGSAEAASRFAVCSTTCTWDAASTAMWSTTSGGATGASIPGASDDVFLDAATCVGGTTCTITTNTNPTISSLTMGTCTASTAGCILDMAVNNNTVTALTISGTGTGNRQLKLGSGGMTATQAIGVSFDWSNTTNFTLTKGTSTISVVSSGAFQLRTLGFGTVTWHNVTVGDTSYNTQIINFSGGITADNLTLSNAGAVMFDGNATLGGTISSTGGPLTTSPAILSVRNGAPNTITVGGASTMTNTVIQNLTKAGAGSITCNNCYDGGGNTGITINPPASGGGRIIGG